MATTQPRYSSSAKRPSKGAPKSSAASSRRLPLLATLLLALCFIVSPVLSLGIISFDYGADSLKTALIKPGMTPDVVLTRDSKRKLSSVVAWKMADRSFGTDASNLATRYPGDSFPDLKLLLGRSADEQDQQLRDRYTALLGSQLVSTDRGTIAATRATDYTKDGSGPDTHTVEEMVAMQLSHARMLAEETAGEKVKVTYPGTIGSYGGLETVVTVPTFWTAAERQAIFDAATLAGFRPRLVSDAAAAATSLALTRNFATPELHLLYDSGHSATRASLVRFSTKSFPTEDLFGTSMKEHTFIEVLSTGWSREAGGLALDEILREILVEKYKESKKSDDVAKNARAMAKLLASASKAKHVLSANQDARVSIEGLIGDVDFRATVTREEFEAAVEAKGLGGSFSSPISDALTRGEAKLSDLTSVIFIGGNTRVPLVQKSVAQAGVPASLVAQNLNADEAMALGAGFYGASFNPQLKMKPVRVADINPYSVVLTDSEGTEDQLWKGSPETLEQEYKHRYYEGVYTDFGFEIGYGAEAAAEGKLDTFGRPLYRAEVEEIDTTLSALKAAGDLNKVETSVNVTFVQRPLGTVVVQSAWLIVKPKKGGGVVGALRSFFSAKSDKEDDTAAADSNSDSATNDTAAAAVNETTPSAETADLLHDKHIRLTVQTIPQGSVKPMSGAAQKVSQDKLYLADATARRKLQREEYRNKLEAYVYRMRELASGGDKTFEESSTSAERSKIESASSETSEWLSSGGGESDRTTVEDLKKRLSSLEQLVTPIEGRMVEARGRSGAAKRMQRALDLTEEFLTEANTNLTAAITEGTSSRYSRTDLDSLQSSLKGDKDWFTKVSKEQEKKKREEEPAWKVDEAEKRARKLLDKVTKLKKRRIPKTRPSSSSASSNAASASGSKSSSAGEGKKSVAATEEETLKHEEL
ncbi:actin-like ATPase domain-containing protein [Microstroma glucosiphilum]|uniref:Actin-like ATPase domain-containing protein n=1 Tax=Pseudomicrostroma glucosiphilum TaxID=1684307 RepID=A0A316U9L7_9BASI|nr:actin-like ATPase domain-containing protein [Pseudomicrostroma glucosiphilum]PWN21849.1 actin-like ATPase domain-containing protein [Pseudomicrostroma glucosiphilum]